MSETVFHNDLGFLAEGHSGNGTNTVPDAFAKGFSGVVRAVRMEPDLVLPGGLSQTQQSLRLWEPEA